MNADARDQRADVVVVGSGASGAMAAVPLVQAGLEVVLLDYGNEDTTYAPLIPSLPFSQIRQSDEHQHRYFLGDNFEGIPFGAVGVGAQLTPPRLHITRDTAERLPVDSASFSATQSLALGGLAEGWGAGAFRFADDELQDLPISLSDLEPHYDAVAEHIGIAGEQDDLAPFLGKCDSLLPPLDIDTNAQSIWRKYLRRRSALNRAGFYLGRPRLAVCTREHRGRGPHRYFDMDFWADPDQSVYRPRWTIEELQKSPNFRYVGRRLALSFAENENGNPELRALNVDTGQEETYRSRALVLAAGTLSTARIVLRSLGRFGHRVPLVSNSYTYAPVINLNMIGREAMDRRHSLTQLMAIYDPPDSGGEIVVAQFYSYRSLLTFKLLKESRLPYREGLRLMRRLTPLFGILGIHHADHPSPSKYCVLHEVEGKKPDRLEIGFELSAREERIQSAGEKKILRYFRRLGCWPIKFIRPGHGSSIHYAGTFPMSASGRELTCSSEGRLAGLSSVYLADGSLLAHLPAKGPTLTMMANAHRIGTRLAGRLK
ncbi:GMC family oxidoreductase [Candidatus Sumerlaeota bacterium]|nr:GMC family oxidoreductase [Candidatus Sumerlaeota bacterium]